MATGFIGTCVVDTKTFDWKTVEQAEAAICNKVPDGWLYRLFFGWDDQRFGGVGVVKLVCFNQSGMGLTTTEARQKVRSMVDSEVVKVYAPSGEGARLEFIVQELGILEGMSDQAGSASVGTLTTSVVEAYFGCPKIKLDRRCGWDRSRKRWKVV
jgi:hypothetical protein